MLRKIFLLITVALSLNTLYGQELWTSAAFKTSVGKHWGFDAEVEYRTHNHLQSTERLTLSASAEYKHRFFKIDAGYKYLITRSLEETTRKGNIVPPYNIGRHRYYASLTGKLKLGRFNLSLRERYQWTHRLGKWVPKVAADGVTPKDDEWIAPKDRHMLRSRLACEWNIRKCRFTPFASVEVYDNLSSGFSIEKVRYTLGSEFKINRRNRLEFFYRFVQGVASGSYNINAIGLGYAFKL